MKPHRRLSLLIDGIRYTAADFAATPPTALSHRSDFHRLLCHLLHTWFADDDRLTVHTSGSTGRPRPMVVEKWRMMQSAQQTCRLFGLNPCNSTLLCMPLEYIAGQMMVVRALVAGLDLHPVAPTGHPLATTGDARFDFAAMVPLQVYNTLTDEVQTNRLQTVGTLLIGGGPIDPTLETRLRTFPNAVYASYGMTETLSHIAVRRVSGPDASDLFTPLPSVTVSQTDDGRLIIDAPQVTDSPILTNDLAELQPDGRFRLLGRVDNVINSGGIKIQVEALEAALQPHINGRFAISSLPDARLGQAVVLVAEQPIEPSLLNLLPPRQRPRIILTLPHIPLTETGKIARNQLKTLIASVERLDTQ